MMAVTDRKRPNGRPPTNGLNLRRGLLLGVIGAHTIFPTLFVLLVGLGVGGGNSHAAGALAATPLLFLTVALIVGPLSWAGWDGHRRWPSAALTIVVTIEALLYRAGSEPASWELERTAANKFAFVLFLAHSVGAALALWSIFVPRPSSPGSAPTGGCGGAPIVPPMSTEDKRRFGTMSGEG